jgi:RHS repeat-associated protein
VRGANSRALKFGSGGEASPQAVVNEAGDRLEVSAARPGNLFKEGSSWVSNCTSIQAELGTVYMPCGYMTWYDANWETTEKAPDTDVVEFATYDSCGSLVTSARAENWHVEETEYITPGWDGSAVTEIPLTEPISCLGRWRLLYVYSQTFSDEQTLTDSIEVPFSVTSVPLLSSAHWGGGNPTEHICWQCLGDPINTETGEYFDSATDLTIPDRGPGLDLSRSYSSAAARAGESSLVGRGWAFSYGMKLAIEAETGNAVITNQNGSRTRFEAWGNGEFGAPPRIMATLIENPNGTYTYTIKARTIYTFDSSGRLVAIADLDGDTTKLTYDEAGKLATASDEAGASFAFDYNGSGRIDEIEDSTGRSVSYSYDESGDLVEVTDVRGSHEHFTYDNNGQLLTRKDARGNVVLTNTYDEAGRILTQTNGVGDETTFSYEEAREGEITEATNPRGFVTLYEYAGGVLERRIDAIGSGHRAEWIYEYDPATLGRTAVTDPNGNTTRMTYDAQGNRTSVENPLGDRTQWAYDPLGDLVEYTDGVGNTATLEYDERGNLLKASTPLVGSVPPETSVVEYFYEDEAHPGDVTTIKNPDGDTTTFTYDSAGNRATETSATGDETTFTWNARGNLTSEVSPRGNVAGASPSAYTSAFTYDPAGDRLTATDPLGDERKWGYDADGNVSSETDANGNTTTFTYDAANQRTSSIRADGHTEHLTYDEDGNIASEVNGREKATTFAYDQFDHLKEQVDPLGRTTAYTFDGAGNLTSSEDAAGRTTTYVHNAADELTGVEYGSEPGGDVEYSYDEAGRLVSMIDATGESTYAYNSLGELTSSTNGHGDTVSYGYDLAGHETSITYPNGKTVEREFDPAGHLSSVSDWLGNTTSFSYDPDADLKAVTFPAGTGDVDQFGYDRAGSIAEIHMHYGAEALAALTYSRDPAGQIEALTSAGLPGASSESFEYDEDQRLTKAGSESFGYDAADDLTSAPGTTNTYDDAGQLEAGTGAVYSYNQLGQRTVEPRLSIAFGSSFGSGGSGTGHFSHPNGIAVDASGNVWVADQNNSRVEKFNHKGEFLSSFGSYGTGNGQFVRPSDIAIDSEGHLWVVDKTDDRVQEFSASGTYLSQFGSAGSGNGQFNTPEGITVDPSGHIWVADTANARAEEFSSAGKFMQSVGTYGSGAGQIQEAVDVAIGAEGHVWITDWANRVDEYTAEGKFLRRIGSSSGTGAGNFVHALAIAISPAGHIWVADEGNNRVQEFDESGNYLGQFGSTGTGGGQFKLVWPGGIALDSEGGIFVADTGNNRIEHWNILEDPSPKTYKYDQHGDLTAVERTAAGESPAIHESYSYDGNGLRSAQTVSGATTQLTWDQSSSLPFLIAEGGTSYIYGPDGIPVEQISSSGVPTYYHHDQLGSTRMLTDASGKATATFSYSAYGSLSGHNGTQSTPLGYTGAYTSTQSGLIYLHARVYDPATGQFLSRDPLEAITGQPYTYAKGNPHRFTDPSGLSVLEDIEGGGFPCISCGVSQALGELLEPSVNDVANGGSWLLKNSLGVDRLDEGESEAEEPCPEEKKEEEEYERITRPREEVQRKEREEVDKLSHSSNSDPSNPNFRPSGSQWKAVGALVGKILVQFVRGH